jgi:integrase/recombinase XerD
MSAQYRDRMIEEMELRGLDQDTKKAYLSSMLMFTQFYKKPPATIDVNDIKRYQLYLLKDKERKLAPNSVNRHLSAIKFFYRNVLGRHWYADALPRVKTKKVLPDILSEEEVGAMIDSTYNVFWKAVIMTTYSSGLRNTEVRNLKVTDIDRKRMILVVRDGKGGVDRHAILSPLTLKCLETYWRLFRLNHQTKSDYLFIPTKNSHDGELNKKLSHTSLGYMIEKAAEFAQIKKKLLPTHFAMPLPFTCLSAGLTSNTFRFC